MALMLDSGAFSAWSQGQKIDLNEYISFCLEHPQVNYYVNLDTIPGSGDGRSVVVGSEVERCCEESWDNYQQMICRLPAEKVIPVFHCGEPVRFLKRMLDSGVGYIGLGGMVGNTRQSNRRWLNSLRTILIQGGRPVVKIHGFGLTSVKMIRMFPWYSVDSSTWARTSAYGQIYIPVTKRGKFDYCEEPLQINVSEASPAAGMFNDHAGSMHGLTRQGFDQWLSEIGIAYGKSELIQVSPSHKLKVGEERWAERGRTIWRVVEMGVSSHAACRMVANAMYFIRTGHAFGLRLYLAGNARERVGVERIIHNRLMSYEVTRLKSTDYRYFLYHCEHTTKEA